MGIMLTGCKAPVAQLVVPVVLWLGVSSGPMTGPPPPVVDVVPTLADSTLADVTISAADCPEAPQLPMLCVSDRALVEYNAGVRKDAPMLLTGPVAVCQLSSQAAGNAICAVTFGEGWEMARTETWRTSPAWDDFSPTGTAFWVWDEQFNELAADE